MKKLCVLIMAVFLFTAAGCGKQPVDEPNGKELKAVMLTGVISATPQQHMIDLQENYPYVDYLDVENTQYVVYSKEKIICAGEVDITGKIIEIQGTSKRPGSDEVYTEEQILVDSSECKEPDDSAENIIDNEYPGKIVYINDISQTENMKADCAKRGGVFNTCGSPCAPDAEICIMVCAYTCEFNGQMDSDTENWLTYSNTELGFSLKYPSMLNKKEREGSIATFSVWGPTQEPYTEFYDGISVSFNKEVYEGSLAFDEFIETQLEVEKEIADFVSDPAPVVVGNKVAFRVDIESLGVYTNYYIQLDSSYYLLISVMAPDPTEQGYAEVVNNMLESIWFETIE